MRNYDPDPKGDGWLRFRGVAAPQRTSHGITEDEIDDLLRKSKHKCKFQQYGNHLKCEEGSLIHGHFVNPRLQPVYRK